MYILISLLIISLFRPFYAQVQTVWSPDAVPVIPADEGPEWAALTPVTVGAHQAICTSAIPSKLAPTHLTGPLQTHRMSTVVGCCSVRAVTGVHLRLGLTTGRGQGRPCTKPSHHHHQRQHHHHLPHLQEHNQLHLWRGELLGIEKDCW